MTINVTHRCASASCGYFGQPSPWSCGCHVKREAMLEEAAEVMLDALKLCIPANVCLTNRNIPDDMTVPLDVPMGDLRKIAAAIAKATRPVAELEKGNRDG